MCISHELWLGFVTLIYTFTKRDRQRCRLASQIQRLPT